MDEKKVASPSPERKRAARSAPLKNPHAILAPAPRAEEHGRVLKHGNTFAVFDQHGDVLATGLGEEGLYHKGTRYLSSLLLEFEEARPLLLGSTIKEDNDLMIVDLSNQDVLADGQVLVPRGTLHLARMKLLWKDVCYERLRILNYGLTAARIHLRISFEADFADIFEVRGTPRKKHGDYLESERTRDSVILGYHGLDNVLRRTRLLFEPAPLHLTDTEALFDGTLAPQQEITIHLAIACERQMGETPVPPHQTPQILSFDQALTEAAQALDKSKYWPGLRADTNKQFNAWTDRALADLDMLVTLTPEGPYPFAGIPWFSTVFGRDGILTALECLWLNPALARGVLGHLATLQATEVDPQKDAEPGKILHEARRGEMATLGEVPFGRYYGSVDSTPLFVFLAGAYYERTGDREFIESIWPNLEAALRWIDTYGDADGDGFVEYARRSATGLVQQGWKDSQDSVFHADGTLAEPPIALCEVQGYVYAARRAGAELAALLGRTQRAEELTRQANDLQERFEAAFWCEDLSTYALALDGKKRPCRVRTSNAGHCLLTGIARRDHACRAAQTLLSREAFSGWGVRTVSSQEVRYNPMAYHNGSVWPHDNALIAYGLARYGLKNGVMSIFSGMYEAGLAFDLHRLPELFCGFTRRAGEGPTEYPVACSPQAWAAAAPFLLLQASLGLVINAPERQLYFSYPLLPDFLREIHLCGLRIGDAVVDLRLLRHGQDVGIHVLRREGEVQIMSVK